MGLLNRNPGDLVNVGRDNSEFVLETLSKSLAEFKFNPDNGSTFEAWFQRFEDVFTQDAKNLDDNAKAYPDHCFRLDTNI